MTLVQPDDDLHLPAYAREVLDVTGAGDTVISMLGTAVAAGMSLPQATALANLAASVVVGKLGAATVNMAELTAAFIDKQNGLQSIVSKTTTAASKMDETQLLVAVKEARASGKKIVFTNGCFDILHAGHVEYLQMAKQLGDYLIVAINTDSSIRELKGAGRPINILEDRMTVLSGLGVVDCVVPFADATPERLLHLVRPDTLVKGGEYRLDQVVGADIVRAYGGNIRVLGEKISSSTSIIDRIVALATNPKPDDGPPQQAHEYD
jgi:D-beta-D-heptose 7-phosphate kinase/D-beta-D-heptose 1-phosphate adenosyltransferase